MILGMLEKWDLNVSGGGGGGGGREEKIEKLKNHRKISFLGDSFFLKRLLLSVRQC